jgi:hypothetical protein
MAGVKFVLMYPRPQDIDTFEHLYQDEDVPIGDGLSSEYAGTFEARADDFGQALRQARSDQGRGDLEWGAAAVLPYRRDLFYVVRRPAGVCAVRRRPGDRGPCRQDLQWRDAAFSCGGRAHAHVWPSIGVGPAESACISSIEGVVKRSREIPWCFLIPEWPLISRLFRGAAEVFSGSCAMASHSAAIQPMPLTPQLQEERAWLAERYGFSCDTFTQRMDPQAQTRHFDRSLLAKRCGLGAFGSRPPLTVDRHLFFTVYV